MTLESRIQRLEKMMNDGKDEIILIIREIVKPGHLGVPMEVATYGETTIPRIAGEAEDAFVERIKEEVSVLCGNRLARVLVFTEAEAGVL